MVIPFGDNGMKNKRSRIVRSFSFRPKDRELLEEVRARVVKYLPDVHDSELVRVALELVLLAPESLLQRIAGTFERVESGRPPTVTALSSDTVYAWEESWGDDKERLRRYALFAELEMLREGPRGEPEIEARIETLSRYFGMVYPMNE